ncbi:MAG: hypothetical protein H0W48_00585 [Methylibium sp.]|nr:hypothetical protein [Methylibium sp.]
MTIDDSTVMIVPGRDGHRRVMNPRTGRLLDVLPPVDAPVVEFHDDGLSIFRGLLCALTVTLLAGLALYAAFQAGRVFDRQAQSAALPFDP